MIYWNNIYWKIISGSLEKISNKTNLIANDKIVLQFKPNTFASDGICIKGSYLGNISIKINDEIVNLNSTDLTNFNLNYIDNKLTVNESTKDLVLDENVKIQVTFDKNSKAEKWCICPKKSINTPSCFINF